MLTEAHCHPALKHVQGYLESSYVNLREGGKAEDAEMNWV